MRPTEAAADGTARVCTIDIQQPQIEYEEKSCAAVAAKAGSLDDLGDSLQ
jgi:hypothetical protein